MLGDKEKQTEIKGLQAFERELKHPTQLPFVAVGFVNDQIGVPSKCVDVTVEAH